MPMQDFSIMRDSIPGGGMFTVYMHKSGIAIGFIEPHPSPLQLAYIDITNASRKQEWLYADGAEHVAPLAEAIISKMKEQLGISAPEEAKEALMESIKEIISSAKLYGEKLSGITNSLSSIASASPAKAGKRIDEIANVLGENNILEQAQTFMFMVAPISAVSRIQSLKEGFASQERSTRYVKFRSFYVPEIEGSSTYIENAAALGKANDAIFERTACLFKDKYGNPDANAMKNLIEPSARDVARSFVGMHCLTSLMLPINASLQKRVIRMLGAMAENGDSAALLLYNAASDYMKENAVLSKHIAPSDFEKRLEEEFDPFIHIKGKHIIPKIRTFSEQKVSLSAYSSTEQQLLAEIASKSGSDPIELAKRLSLLRESKHSLLLHTPLDSGRIDFELEGISYATMRDLQRHRLADTRYAVACKELPPRGSSPVKEVEFILPDIVAKDAKLKEIADGAIASSIKAYNYFTDKANAASSKAYEYAAINSLPISIGVNMHISCTLAEAIYIIENRGNSREAMPEYWSIAWGMYDALAKAYPSIMKEIDIKVSREPNQFSRDITKVEKTTEANRLLF
ncbi:MAG: FAD-dependent thymidylate synthase [Candidatus Micrarchaeaceae archaeon]